MTPTVIRAARAGDLDAVVEVFLGCWTTSYPPLLPAATVTAMDRATAIALWRPALAAAASTVLVAEAGAVQGVARCTVEASQERVDSLYVHPDVQGGGVGGLLLTACTDVLRSRGARRAALWVFAANRPALAFYARRGWRPTGRERVEPEYGAPELQLERELAP